MMGVMALNTPRILAAAIAEARALMPAMEGDHLDIGAGHGDLVAQLREEGAKFRSRACDYAADLMKLRDVPVDVIDLNEERLPYADASFDLVTCTEVVEHIEHYRESLREVHRVLRPGGVFVVTTPNILNLKSRVRFLFFGFYNLFGPLHIRESRRYSTGGHINPVSLFYLSHALLDAGFRDLRVSFDKRQRGSMAAALLLFPFIWIYSRLAIRREGRRYKTIDDLNIGWVKQVNAWDTLLGRTVVFGCRK